MPESAYKLSCSPRVEGVGSFGDSYMLASSLEIKGVGDCFVFFCYLGREGLTGEGGEGIILALLTRQLYTILLCQVN